MMIDPQVWKDHIAGALTEFSSREFQERVWLRGEGPEVSSYIETVMRFFDFVDGPKSATDRGELGISDRQWAALTSFRRVLHPFVEAASAYPDAKELLDNPAWKEIQAAAAVALETFQAG
jgi:hypothetical protein